MKTKKAIKERRYNKATLYYPAGRTKKINNVGEFPTLIQSMWEYDDTVQMTFKLTAITTEFVYYVNDEEIYDVGGVVMLNRCMKLVSDNFFASNDLAVSVQNNDGFLWISNAVKYWQREQFVKPQQITPKIKKVLNMVDVEKLNDKEKTIYLAYLHNGPAKYTKPESLMAVLSNFDESEYSDQIALIAELLEKNQN